MIVISNGGEALPGSDCPTDWDSAKAWTAKANGQTENNNERPEWSFDCGFKLDFDGPLLFVSSRFYPPKIGYGPGWNGAVTVFSFGEKLSEKSFDCESLEELKTKVEDYVFSIREKVVGFIANI